MLSSGLCASKCPGYAGGVMRAGKGRADVHQRDVNPNTYQGFSAWFSAWFVADTSDQGRADGCRGSSLIQVKRKSR